MPYFVHIDAAGLYTVTVFDAVIPLRGILVHLVQVSIVKGAIRCTPIHSCALCIHLSLVDCHLERNNYFRSYYNYLRLQS